MLILFGFGVSILFSIISLSTASWVSLSTNNDDTNYGLFLKEATGGTKLIETKCVSEMPDLQCSYLNSSKGCGIIFVLFGALAFLSQLYSFGDFNKQFVGFVASLLGLFQTVFGLMCLVFYSYFKESYLETNDDINIEYPNGLDVEYDWSFNLMISAVVIGFVASFYSLVTIYHPSFKKSNSSEKLFSNA